MLFDYHYVEIDVLNAFTLDQTNVVVNTCKVNQTFTFHRLENKLAVGGVPWAALMAVYSELNN